MLSHVYLKVKENLKMMRVLKWYLWLIIISCISGMVYYYTPVKNYHIVIAMPVVSLIYAVMVIAFIIKKDDIRIVKEMVNISTPPSLH